MSERIAKRIKASTYRDIARYASVMIGNDLGISDIRIRLQNDRDKFYVREGDTFVFDCLDPITKAVEKWIKRYGECEDKTISKDERESKKRDTMTRIEMLNELTKNPDKIFQYKQPNGFTFYRKGTDLMMENSCGENYMHQGIFCDSENFIEVVNDEELDKLLDKLAETVKIVRNRIGLK